MFEKYLFSFFILTCFHSKTEEAGDTILFFSKWELLLWRNSPTNLLFDYEKFQTHTK